MTFFNGLLTQKVNDRSQRPLMFDLSQRESAGSGSLDRPC